jgi:cell division protein FtsB
VSGEQLRLKAEQMAKLSFLVGSTGLNLILLIVLALIAFDCLVNPAGLWDLTVLRRDRTQLEETRNRLQIENAQRKETIDRLHTDDAYLQRLIHQELGYVRPDELIYRFAGSSDDSEHTDSGPSTTGAK